MNELPLRTKIAIENTREGQDGLTQQNFDNLVNGVPIAITDLLVARNFPTVTAVPVNVEYANAQVDDVGAFDVAAPANIVVPENITHCRMTIAISWAGAITGTRKINLLVNGAAPVNRYYPLQDIRNTNGAADEVTTQFVSPIMEVTTGDILTINALQNSGAGIGLADINSTVVIEWFNKHA